jgi:hypothetical protein
MKEDVKGGNLKYYPGICLGMIKTVTNPYASK